MEPSLNTIIETFGLPDRPRTQAISKDDVIIWMKSENIEVLGALYSFLMKKEHAVRINPPLTKKDYFDFLTRYFERCLYENPNGDWSDSRYAAARGFRSLFEMLWNNRQVEHATLTRFKDWLAKVYKQADEPVRRCIVDGALEHLFENPEIVEYFYDWKYEPQLEKAYAEAIQWSNNGGNGHAVR